MQVYSKEEERRGQLVKNLAVDRKFDIGNFSQNFCSSGFEIFTDTYEISWKVRRRKLHFNSSKYNYKTYSFVLLCSFLFTIGNVVGNSDTSVHRLTKRVAILDKSPSLLVPVPLNLKFPLRSDIKIRPIRTDYDANTLYLNDSLLSLHDSISGRVMFPKSSKNFQFPEQKHQKERSERGLGVDSGVEVGRKASPDVQDIIDGIVKLLGGKVHTPTTNSQANKNKNVRIPLQNQQNQQYHPNNHAIQHYQNQMIPPQQISHQSHFPLQNLYPNQQQMTTSGPIPLNRPYNLFNPSKPLFYQTVKPARINNRGPPIAIPSEKPESQFEVIPLEVLHKDLDRDQTFEILPPFSHPSIPNSSSGQQGTLHNEHEAPYKLGVPLPERLVPQNDHFPQNLLYSSSTSSPPLSIPVDHKDRRPTQRPGVTRLSTPLQSQLQTDSIEDDEKDAEKLVVPVNLGVSINSFTLGQREVEAAEVVEPTITEESELPTFMQNITNHTTNGYSTSTTSTSTLSQLSTISTFTTATPYEYVNPSTASAYSNTIPTMKSSVSNFVNSSTLVNPIVQNKHLQRPTQTKSPVFPQKGQENYKGTMGTGTSTNIQASVATPTFRPGIVLPDDTPVGETLGSQAGFGSVEVVTSDGNHATNHSKPGDIFDITVTAQQNFGQASVNGQPFVIPVDLSEEIITAPNGNQQFVSIDGKRTYFNLHSSSTLSHQTIEPTTSNIFQIQATTPPPFALQGHPGVVGAPTHPFAPLSSPSNRNRPTTTTSLGIGTANKSVGTSLKITGSTIGDEKAAPPASPSLTTKTPTNIIRRPITRRPPIPPVRIDTCIVGDDSTCNSAQYEICRTENGVSSCMCRPGYARKRHREPCKGIVSLVVSIRLDKLGDKKLSYNPEYFNPNSEIYQSIEWETIHGLDSAFTEASLQSGYIGSKLEAIGFDGRHVVVNSTVLIQETPNVGATQVKRDIQRHLIDTITRNRNNLGKSQLWVEGPISAINAIADLNECANPELNDCDEKSKCVNTYGSFECRCEPGYGDGFENNKKRSGRKCESCNSKVHCNGRGECLIENGQNFCRCTGNYYGSQCDIDGEVLAVAIGASVSAVVIIALTLICLCMWSRRWKREEQKAAIMSRTLFGGMASQAMSYLSKNSVSSGNPYQQHYTLDERLRWAQVDPTLNGAPGNIYVQTEPMSLHTSPGSLIGTSMMDTPSMLGPARRSADTCDTTIDDMFEDRNREERQVNKRPKSRSSQLHGGSQYYDLEGEPQSDIYAARGPPFLPFPAQFCVPTSPMNPYPHSRGYYN